MDNNVLINVLVKQFIIIIMIINVLVINKMMNINLINYVVYQINLKIFLFLGNGFLDIIFVLHVKMDKHYNGYIMMLLLDFLNVLILVHQNIQDNIQMKMEKYKYVFQMNKMKHKKHMDVM